MDDYVTKYSNQYNFWHKKHHTHTSNSTEHFRAINNRGYFYISSENYLDFLCMRFKTKTSVPRVELTAMLLATSPSAKYQDKVFICLLSQTQDNSFRYSLNGYSIFGHNVVDLIFKSEASHRSTSLSAL